MTKLTNQELDELLPTVVRVAVGRALWSAQNLGLIKFPSGPLPEHVIQERLDIIVGEFIEAVKEQDLTLKKG